MSNTPKVATPKEYKGLWEDVIRTKDEGVAVRTLAKILSDREGRVFVSNLKYEEALLCIELLDHAIAEHDLRSAEKQAFFTTLRRLAGIHGRLPGSMIITETIEVEDQIHASGGFADVRRGSYKGHLVAVKTLRVAQHDDLLKIRKGFCKEAILWNTVSHPNVLKLAGIQGDMNKGQFVAVSEWMAHGNIMQYIATNHVNRLELLCGAAQGLEYLHRANLTHGDLKGTNILISNHEPPRACLADFGFMTTVLDPNGPMSCSAQFEGGTSAFQAPELLVPRKFGLKNGLPTPQADVYAFGLVVLQVLTGQLPFRGIRQAEVIYSVVEGVRPSKPEDASAIGLSDPLWDFVQRCWDGDSKLRPAVSEVVEHLELMAQDWDSLVPPLIQIESDETATVELRLDPSESCSLLPPSIATKSSESEGPSGLSSHPNTPCTAYTELLQEVQEVPAQEKPVDTPQPESSTPLPVRQEELNNDLHEEEHYPHLDDVHQPSPTRLPMVRHSRFREFMRSKYHELVDWIHKHEHHLFVHAEDPHGGPLHGLDAVRDDAQDHPTPNLYDYVHQKMHQKFRPHADRVALFFSNLA